MPTNIHQDRFSVLKAALLDLNQRSTNSQCLESWGEIKEILEQSQRTLLGLQAAKEQVKNVSFTNYQGERGTISSKLIDGFVLLNDLMEGKVQFKQGQRTEKSY